MHIPVHDERCEPATNSQVWACVTPVHLDRPTATRRVQQEPRHTRVGDQQHHPARPDNAQVRRATPAESATDGTPRAPAGKVQALPIRLPEDSVAALDEAWGRYGFPTRMGFIRHAFAVALIEFGEAETGRRFGKAKAEVEAARWAS